MKKIISILSVSLFAVVFAAGCGGGDKVAKCESATKVKACKDGTKDDKKCVVQYKKNDDASKKDDADVEKCFETGDAVKAAMKAVCEAAAKPAVSKDNAAEQKVADDACADAVKVFSADEEHKCTSGRVVGDADSIAGKCVFTPKP